MKKRFIVLGAILAIGCIIAVVAVNLSTPAPIIDSAQDFHIYRVVVCGSDDHQQDITAQIDCSQLAQSICFYTRNKLPHFYNATQFLPGDIEIDGTCNNKPLHILLGTVNAAYESGNQGLYTIQNSEQLMNEVRSLIP